SVCTSTLAIIKCQKEYSMLSNSPFSKQMQVNRFLVRLFNVTLAIIFLSWVIVDGVVDLLKKLVVPDQKQENRIEMKNNTPKLKPVFLAGLVAAIFISCSSPAKAGEDSSHVEARKLQASGEILPFEK